MNFLQMWRLGHKENKGHAHGPMVDKDQNLNLGYATQELDSQPLYYCVFIGFSFRDEGWMV